MKILRLISAFAIFTFALPILASAQPLPSVHFIGASYAGRYASISDRFHYSALIDHFSAGNHQPGTITARLLHQLAKVHPNHFNLTTQQIHDVKNVDEAIDLTMLISKENVLQTSYEVDNSKIYKVLAQVRAQAFYFDVTQSALVRDIPLSFTQISTFKHKPTEDEIQHCVVLALFGSDGKSGLVGKFSDSIVNTPYPTSKNRFLRIKSVAIAKRVYRPLGIPESDRVQLVSDLKNRIADNFADTLSADYDVSFIPYTSDYVVGNRIPLSMSNGDAYDIKLPTADYLFYLKFLGAKKILFGQSVAGKSLIYGTYFNVRLLEPLSNHVYLDSKFKNGVVLKIPSTQTSDSQSDRFAYDDSMRSLFKRLSHAINVGRTSWITKAASAANIGNQLQSTKDLLQKCE